MNQSGKVGLRERERDKEVETRSQGRTGIEEKTQIE